jgi:hypothetical protein
MTTPRVGEIWKNNEEDGEMYMVTSDPYLAEMGLLRERQWVVKIRNIRKGWEIDWRTICWYSHIWEKVA